MDNLAHTLAGAALGEAGLKRRTGLATATLLIGANLPDVDVLAIPFGESLPFRRGWTHGSLAWVVLPLVLTGLVVGYDRWQARRGRRPAGRPAVHPREVLLLSALAVWSHPLLDWLNTYGIRLLMPFSERWYYGDALFIIDPWLWLILGVGVALARARARRAREGAARPARIALAVALVYVGAMVAGSRVAREAAAHAIARQERGPASRIMAGPVPLNPLERELVWETPDAYGTGSVHFRPAPEVVLNPAPIPRRSGYPAVRAAAQVEEMADFLYWARFPFFRVEPVAGGVRVQVRDARYGERGPFGVRVVVPDP